MSIVTLVSGGLDSTLMAVLARESGIQQFPLFVDYGQRSNEKELAACLLSLKLLGLPAPTVVRVPEFGKVMKSGLTDASLNIVEDAFTPGRNFLFLLLGAGHAYSVGASAVAIGLLHESTCLFPDQTSAFLEKAQGATSEALGRRIQFLAPLRGFFKSDVVELARSKGIANTYSCHSGADTPCGVCISCREFKY